MAQMAATALAALLLILQLSAAVLGRHECDRPCRDGASMECHHTFVLSVGIRRCENAKSEECRRRPVLTINGESPGPFVSLCRNDTLAVTVRNALPLGMEAAIHWHGLRQRGTPHMDGAGMVTQCPIHSGTSFRYLFKAEEAGTFYYHAHSVLQHMDGLYGALVVRAAGDPTDRVVLLAPQLDHLTSFQQGVESDLTVSELKFFAYGEDVPDRVRLINAAALDCPVSVRREAGSVTVLAVDGNDVNPVELPQVVLHPGERVDVTDTPSGLRAIGHGLCAGHGVTLEEGVHPSETPAEVDTQADYLKPFASAYPSALDGVSQRVYLPFDLSRYSYLDNPVDFRYKLGEVTPYVPSAVNGNADSAEVYQFRNVTFVYPSSPTLSQWGDVDGDLVCPFGERAPRCGSGRFCECLQLVTLPYNKTVDLVLIDEGWGGKSQQTVHLHGHRFHVTGAASFDRPVTTDFVRGLVESGRAEANSVRPAVKDTVAVPNAGYVILRVRTDNPGDWLLESIPSKAKTGIGLEVVLRVPAPGGSIPVPVGFPRCGTVKPRDLVIMDE